MHLLLRAAGSALAAAILSAAGASAAAAADAPRHDVAGPVIQRPAGPWLPGEPQVINGEGDWP